jgi:hypothetical protein
MPSGVYKRTEYHKAISRKNGFKKGHLLTPQAKLNHKEAARAYWLKYKVDGLRKCTICNKQKEEKLFVASNISLHKNTGLCLECKRKKDSVWYYKHIKQARKYYRSIMKDPVRYAKNRKQNIIAVSKIRSGLNRLETILPNTRCYVCGITQTEHLEKVKRFGKGLSLSIHHVDNKGRRAMRMGFKPNNAPDNLMILCSADHTRQHNHERDYTGNGEKIWATRRKNMQQTKQL